MKKLLHERLREIVDSRAQIKCVDTLVGINCSGSGLTCDECVKSAADTLADEIEKYYIPRPRFEDGEPIQVGDIFVQKFINEEVELDKIGIALFTNDGLNMVYSPGEVIQRPEPKVFDADGVEIKVGDTVWTINVPKGNDKRIVSGFKLFSEMGTTDGDKPSTHAVMFDGGGWMGNLRVTHREPDSLGKILEDMMGDDHMRGTSYIRRIQAIMERDA